MYIYYKILRWLINIQLYPVPWFFSYSEKPILPSNDTNIILVYASGYFHVNSPKKNSLISPDDYFLKFRQVYTQSGQKMWGCLSSLHGHNWEVSVTLCVWKVIYIGPIVA